jgi:hypothetical protein
LVSLFVKRRKRIHFLYLKDKVAVQWNGKHINIVGWKALVKLVLTAQAIYPLTAIDVAVEYLQAIQKLIRGCFLASTGKASGGNANSVIRRYVDQALMVA